MKNIKNNLGLFILFLILMGIIGFIYIKNNNKKPVPVKKEEISYTEKEIENIYNLIDLSFEEESSLSNDELLSLDKGMTKDKLFDEYILAIAISNIDIKKYRKENLAKDIVDNEGYVYKGIYIEEGKINVRANEIFKDIKFNHKTVKFVNKKYVYDASRKIYRVYEKAYKPTIDKVTYIESSWDNEYIYITEYVAYTRLNSNPQTSYTRHNNMLPINITDTNIIENLDIIDKYKYTFKVEDKNYYLEKIEYVK